MIAKKAAEAAGQQLDDINDSSEGFEITLEALSHGKDTIGSKDRSYKLAHVCGVCTTYWASHHRNTHPPL